jgi:hypothetical protein
MSTMSLGRLERVELRDVWIGEASDFTPWLAQEKNLELLGETIGLDLQWEATEKDVGPFRADILCRDTVTNAYVLVENQLERTDHTHLGQLITYAAGLKAVTIVWIARQITEEHRAALDWLNEITLEGVNFFGLEIELWRIGDSQIAPKFNVVSKPNDWADTVRGSAALSANLSESQQLYREYWAKFMDYVEQNSTNYKRRTPQAQYWMDFAVGRSSFTLQTVASIQKKYLCVQLVIQEPNSKPHFHALFADKPAIELEIGSALKWVELPEKKSSYISIYDYGKNPADRGDWASQHEWLLARLEAFRHCFASRVKSLVAPASGALGSEDLIEKPYTG